MQRLRWPVLVTAGLEQGNKGILRVMMPLVEESKAKI